MRSRKKIAVVSLFTGAGGLDVGLEKAGLDVRICSDNDTISCETIRLNSPKIPVLEQDIREVSSDEILQASNLLGTEYLCVTGGPPCQAFSTGGKRRSILDPRGSLFMDYLRVIEEVRPHYFVFENVAQIVTAAVKHRPIDQRPGKNWNLSAYSKNRNGGLTSDVSDAPPLEDDELSGSAIKQILEEFSRLEYFITFKVLNAADYGVPQRRLRFIMIGSRMNPYIRLPNPSHSEFPSDGLKRWLTLGDALNGLNESNPLHSVYQDETRAVFDEVPPGGNWKSLPDDLQRKALGPAYNSGGGKTGFFRRLAWDEPAPTITAKPNRKSSAICHPSETRPLTVRECARVQTFPDDYQFAGSMHRQYLQIGNAVPVRLGFSIGTAINQAHEDWLGKPDSSTNGNSELEADSFDHSIMLQNSVEVLRRYSRNRRNKPGSKQPSLF